jgi:ankyrin repeat protein
MKRTRLPDELSIALLNAAGSFGAPEVAALLAQPDVDIHCKDDHGFTPLMRAVRNPLHGLSIVPLLLDAGAVVDESTLHLAMQSTGHMLRLLLGSKKNLHAGRHCLSGARPLPDSADPVGVMREASGIILNNEGLRSRAHPPAFQWAMQRCSSHGLGPHNFRHFGALACVSPPSFLYWMARECIFRDSITGETLLHVAARSGKVANLLPLFQLWINPFLMDCHGDMALDIALQPDVKSALERYMYQPLCRQVADWYGPYFIGRARALLLVLQRWRTERILVVPPRDVVHMILDRLRACEYI